MDKKLPLALGKKVLPLTPVFLGVLCFLSMHFSYEFFDIYLNYRKHRFVDVSCVTQGLSLLLSLLPAPLFSLHLRRPSQIFLLGLYCFTYIPIMVVTPRHMSALNWHFWFFLSSMTLSFIALTLITQKWKSPALSTVFQNLFLPPLLSWGIAWVGIVGVFCVLYWNFGFSPLMTFELSQGHAIRMQSRSLIEPFFFLNYFFMVVLNPLLFVYGLRHKHFVFSAASFLLQIYFLTITAAKFYLFIMVALACCYYVIYLTYSYFLYFIAFLPPFLLTSSVIEYYLLKTYSLHELVLGRGCTLQATLTALYYDYFSSHGPRFLSDISCIRKLFALPEP